MLSNLKKWQKVTIVSLSSIVSLFILSGFIYSFVLSIKLQDYIDKNDKEISVGYVSAGWFGSSISLKSVMLKNEESIKFTADSIKVTGYSWPLMPKDDPVKLIKDINHLTLEFTGLEIPDLSDSQFGRFKAKGFLKAENTEKGVDLFVEVYDQVSDDYLKLKSEIINFELSDIEKLKHFADMDVKLKSIAVTTKLSQESIDIAASQRMEEKQILKKEAAIDDIKEELYTLTKYAKDFVSRPDKVVDRLFDKEEVTIEAVATRALPLNEEIIKMYFGGKINIEVSVK